MFESQRLVVFNASNQMHHFHNFIRQIDPSSFILPTYFHLHPFSSAVSINLLKSPITSENPITTKPFSFK